MKRTTKRLLGKRGFSLVEVVVALAIIVTVSAAAMTFIKASSISSARELAYSEARLYTSDALEIFKYAKDKTQFDQLVKDKLTLPDERYVSVEIETSSWESSEKTLTATVKKQNGDTLFTLKYKK